MPYLEVIGLIPHHSTKLLLSTILPQIIMLPFKFNVLSLFSWNILLVMSYNNTKIFQIYMPDTLFSLLLLFIQFSSFISDTYFVF